MKRIDETPRLFFVGEFTAQDAELAQVRGYLTHVMVEFSGDRLYPVTFYDAVRLGQDLAEMAKHGEPFIADAGMIVVKEVSRATMELAVSQLAKRDYFEHFIPMTKEQLSLSDPYEWPPRRFPSGG